MAKAHSEGIRLRTSKRKKVTIPPFGGDHGTGTQAAMAGTVVIPVKDGKGRNPNNMGRRVRRNELDCMKDLSMRQLQAGQEIQEAYCQVEMLSSGGELKEWIQSSPKPDQCIAAQVDAASRLANAMKKVPKAMRYIVEHVCWHNIPIGRIATGRAHGCHKANLKIALDLVANHFRY